MNQSRAPRYFWNDDERKMDYISYYDDYKTEEYIPVYKILKEMYDEDKANLYIYSSEEEYSYKYGTLFYEEFYQRYYELYGDCYDFYPISSIESDVEEENDTNENTYMETNLCTNNEGSVVCIQNKENNSQTSELTQELNKEDNNVTNQTFITTSNEEYDIIQGVESSKFFYV